jgi:hypothetical protein
LEVLCANDNVLRNAIVAKVAIILVRAMGYLRYLELMISMAAHTGESSSRRVALIIKRELRNIDSPFLDDRVLLVAGRLSLGGSVWQCTGDKFEVN